LKLAVTILVFCVAALLALGIVMLYSSSMAQSGTKFLLKQLFWCVVGFGFCIAAALIDYRHLKRIWWVMLAVAIVLLALVLIPGIGSLRNGARRWFSFGSVTLQPSEFGKLALLVAVAWYGERYRRFMGTWKRGIVVPGILIGVVTGLIFKEPDVGSALVLGAVCCGVLLLAGIRMLYFLPPVLAVLAAVGLFIYHNPMRSERVYSWLHLEETKLDKGRQGWEAKIALGHGGLTGQGLGDSRQKLGWVAEHHTDFIFPIIGEELGLIATLLVVAGFVAILLCSTCIVSRAADTFGFLLGSGITLLISLQALINIAVVTSTLPNKGLPLPFISYGGSNLVLMMTCVGILLSIARQARAAEGIDSSGAGEEQPTNPFARRGTAKGAAT
jgi:cell division protein FtsW